MARIRTIKPDFWTDDALTECSLSARLLFIGTWNFADDNGNLDRSSKQLKARIFPHDDVDTESLIRELLSQRLLIEYAIDNKIYLHIRNFRKHQRINRPSTSTIPEYDDSLMTHGALTEHSHTEGKGREGKGNKDYCAKPNGHARFDDWWTILPREMKIGKKNCLEIWKRKHMDEFADELIADIRDRVAKDQKWIDGYAPRAPTYLRQERWEDAYQRRHKQ